MVLRYEFSDQTIKYEFNYFDLNWGFKFNDEIEELLNYFKPWYSFISKISAFQSILLLFTVLFLILIWPGFIKIYDKSKLDFIILLQSARGVGFLVAIILLGFAFILNKITNYLFPKSFLALGYQLNEYKKRKNISYIIFGVIILGIILNLIASFIFTL